MRALAGVFVLLLASCGGRIPGDLAVYRGGVITLADLDAHIQGLPESQRVLPAGEGSGAWLEKQLRHVALTRLLKGDPETQRLLQNSETGESRTWRTVFQLAQAVRAQTLASIEPAGDAWIAERLAAMRAQNDRLTFFSFRHLFLRKDSRKKFETEAEVRRFAADLAVRAHGGGDFAELVKAHSQSADAAEGGLVENNLRRDLDPGLVGVLDALPEGVVSELVETRTGFHLFKMERKVTPEFDEQEALARIHKEWAATVHNREVAALLEAAKANYPVTETEDGFATESWSIRRAFLSRLSPETNGEGAREWAVRNLVLAEEGRARGLLTDDLERQVGRAVEAEILAKVFSERLEVFVDGLDEARFRTLYEAGPSGFGEPERAHLQLIFVPKGKDSFATQQALERKVDALRAGSSFADLAREISVGPNAESGGDLGALEPREWSRLHPEIYEAVVNMEPGAISDPVFCTEKILSADERLLRGGFAILNVVSKSQPRILPFEEVSGRVRDAFFLKNRQTLEVEFQKKLLDESGFRILRLPEPAELAP